MELPIFRYHPDPIQTGSIKVSDNVCIVCGRGGGYIYTSHAYSIHHIGRDCICPWCIADGSAHRKLKVVFTDREAIMGGNTVPKSVVDKIVQRTPGFSGWQDESWMTHCQDGAAFLGCVGYEELKQHGQEAVEAIRLCVQEIIPGTDERQQVEFLEHLNKEGQP